MIQVQGLTRRYGTITAVSDLTFSIEKGEIVGFLGPNGAGKTTTMNMITGCLHATSGSITLDGISMETDADHARRSIGYLPELPPLYPDMTVQEYLQFVYELKKCRLPREEHLSHVCTLAGLSDVLPRLIRNLSKGYRQRVGLAQALVGDPEILILDEPTVGLDPRQITELRAVIRQLGEQHTILLSSHILPEVQEVCDRVLVLHHGTIVADGTPAELSAHAQDAEHLHMTIEGEPETVLAILQSVPGVDHAEVTQADGKKSIYHIAAEPHTDVRRDVFDALSQHQMAILSMQQVERSLEDIFLALTDAEQPEPQEEPPAEPQTDRHRLFHRKKRDRS